MKILPPNYRECLGQYCRLYVYLYVASAEFVSTSLTVIDSKLW